MLGVAIMATLPGERPLPRPRELMAATAVLAVFVGLVLVPASYWKPKWSEMELNPSNTYVARLLMVEPFDRLSLARHCGSNRLCSNLPLPVGISDHQRVRFEIYRYLVNADSSGSVDVYYSEIYEGVVEQRNTNDCCVADTSFSYGLPGDRPVAGDWDGLPPASPADPKAGADTPGFFRAGVWLLRNSNSEGRPDLEFGFGQAGDLPVVGDWNGNGIDTVGVFRKGRWLLRNFNNAGPSEISFDFGAERDRPVSGDWDGDGVDTVGVFTQGVWRLRNTNTGGLPDLDFYFGAFNHRPITGDWNDDGVDTIGIAR
jgi:hypothetical protein